MTSTVFYGDLYMIFTKENGIDGVLRRYKYDFHEENMALTAVDGYINIICWRENGVDGLLQRSKYILRREDGFDVLLRRSKHDFDGQKMSSF